MTRWNIMLYLAGDNNLSEDMVWTLAELEKVKVRIGSNVIAVQFDPRGSRCPCGKRA